MASEILTGRSVSNFGISSSSASRPRRHLVLAACPGWSSTPMAPSRHGSPAILRLLQRRAVV